MSVSSSLTAGPTLSDSEEANMSALRGLMPIDLGKLITDESLAFANQHIPPSGMRFDGAVAQDRFKVYCPRILEKDVEVGVKVPASTSKSVGKKSVSLRKRMRASAGAASSGGLRMDGGDGVDEASQAEYALRSQIFCPKWNLLENESVTSDGRSALKFYTHCLPVADRESASNMPSEALEIALAQSQCKTLALSRETSFRVKVKNDLLVQTDKDWRRALQDVEKLSAANAELKAELGEKDLLLAALQSSPSSSRKKISELEAKLEKMAVDHESEKEEMRKNESEELSRMYELGYRDLMRKAKAFYPNLDLECCIPDPEMDGSEPSTPVMDGIGMDLDDFDDPDDPDVLAEDHPMDSSGLGGGET